MDLNSLGLPIAFIILASILLWFIIGSKGYWWVKGIAIAITLYFSFAMWASLGDLCGWPSDKQLPHKFQVHWIVIKEPLKGAKADDGAIYMWVKELDLEHKPKETARNPYLLPLVGKPAIGEPRVHTLPYSQELHKKAAGALGQIRAGKNVVGQNDGTGEGLAGDGEGGTGKGKGREGTGMRDGNGDGDLSRESDLISFYELPPSRMPPKNGPYANHPPSESLGEPAFPELPRLPGPRISAPGGRPQADVAPENPFQ